MKADFKYYPLQDIKDLQPLIDDIGDSRIVMLGEASHGTSDYYTWRTAISRRLVEDKGFNFIAVEGDWPDCYEVNRFVKGYKNTGQKVSDVLQIFKRWPTWMWANWEVAGLVEWLREINHIRQNGNKIGFYGLDVYSLWESMEQIMHYLDRKDGSAAEAAKLAFQCFEPYFRDPQHYAQATRFVPTDCEDEVLEMLHKVTINRQKNYNGDIEEAFNTEQNALVAVNAEKYYRAMIRGGGNSWNVRDTHMMETLTRLLDLHGPNSKAIIWEHNTHIGDARATDMAEDRMVNIGQLAREKYGRDKVYLAGFGSYQGTVIAGRAWEAPMQIMDVPPAMPGSWECKLHDINTKDKLILSKDLRDLPEYCKPIGHRAIGVVYNPKTEKYGNYVPSVIPERYDAFLYLDETDAVRPIKMKVNSDLPPELYPENE